MEKDYMITGKLPKRFRYPIQHFLTKAYCASPLATRYGKTFWQTYNFLQESQWWSREKLEEYQMQQLSKLLHHAYENVPYYRKIFDGRGLKPKDIQEPDDLKKLPCLDKDTFKLHFSEMVARNVSRKRFDTATTSGTTGKPLQFYQDRSEIEKEWAFIFHQWARAGYKPGEPRVALRGAVICGDNPIEYHPKAGVLRLSPRIDDERAAQYYLKKIKSFGAKFIHGYPSAIGTFAHILQNSSLKVPFKLKAVFFASETVYDWEREIVQEAFNCQVFAHYGQAEHVSISAECEHSHYYHFIPQYGIVEIDPDTHEIVATGFLNFVNPFIRYRTTDVVSSPVLSKCEHCGRNYFPAVERVEGRLWDFIVTPKGALLSPTVISWCLKPLMYKYLGTIKESQLIQTSVDHIIWRVIPYDKNVPKIRKADLQRLHQDLQKILGSDIQIKVEVVDEIERLKSGKFKRIISKVSKSLIEKGLDKF